MYKYSLLILFILTLVSCDVVKYTNKLLQYSDIYSYSSGAEYIYKWEKKWTKKYSPKYRIDFQEQAKNLLYNQMRLLNNYINKGDSYNSKKQAQYIKSTLEFVRLITKDISYLSSIDNLNDTYLSRSENLAKITLARIQFQKNNYEQWQNIWDKIYTNKEQYILDSFINQANEILKRFFVLVDKDIQTGNDTKCIRDSKMLKKLYTYVRDKFPEYDNSYKEIENLNDEFIAKSVNMARINRARIFIREKEFEQWLDKWEEIDRRLKEEYLIDSFKKQSVIVFSKLFNEILYFKSENSCQSWEEKSELIINLYDRTLKLYPDFVEFEKSEAKLINIQRDYLKRLNREAKICRTQQYLNQKSYKDWINKWTEIASEHFLNNIELEIFNRDTKKIFSLILSDIEEAKIQGNYYECERLSNLALKFLNNSILYVNPNYIPTEERLNSIYLSNIKYFAGAQNKFLNGEYKASIEYLLSYCGDNLAKPQLNNLFQRFFIQVLQKNVELYKNAVMEVNFDKQTELIKQMNDIYSLKPDYLNISYVPDYMNPNKRYRTFYQWLEQIRTNTISSFFDQADYLINNNLYTEAYDFIFSRANKIATDPESKARVENYKNIFETQGTDYYKNLINSKINNNQYFIAKDILNNQLIKINPDFKETRSSEYWQIYNNIKNKGTKFFVQQRDKEIDNQQWQYAYNYCDSIHIINPSYNYQQCKLIVDFEQKYLKAKNEYNSDKYLCAIDILDQILNYDIEENRKSKAYNLKQYCQENAIITVGIDVYDAYLDDNIENYITENLQDYKNNYQYSQYLEITNSSNADFIVYLSIDNLDYDAEWTDYETKYACVMTSRKVTKTRTVEEKVTQQVGAYTFYLVVASDGNQYYITNINGGWFLLVNNTWVPFYLNFNYVTVQKSEQYIATQYKYNRISYIAKYAKEYISFKVNIKLKNRDGYLKYSDYNNFSYSENYIKYQYSGSYDIDNFIECPTNCSVNTWLDGKCYTSYIDTKYFNTSSDPFYGKYSFYRTFLKNDLYNFIKNSIYNIMEKVEEEHQKMQCN